MMLSCPLKVEQARCERPRRRAPSCAGNGRQGLWLYKRHDHHAVTPFRTLPSCWKAGCLPSGPVRCVDRDVACECRWARRRNGARHRDPLDSQRPNRIRAAVDVRSRRCPTVRPLPDVAGMYAVRSGDAGSAAVMTDPDDFQWPPAYSGCSLPDARLPGNASSVFLCVSWPGRRSRTSSRLLLPDLEHHPSRQPPHMTPIMTAVIARCVHGKVVACHANSEPTIWEEHVGAAARREP